VSTAASVVVLAAACAVLLASCASSSPSRPTTSAQASDRAVIIPLPNFALPPRTVGCRGATVVSGGATRVPVTVSTVGTQVAVLANMCIDGRGPFPFVIDTGATESQVATSLAARLHLPSAGPKEQFEGVGCTGTSEPRTVTSWSLAGLSLSGQVVSAASLPGMGGRGQPDGLLGSDVLSRFGAVRFDFTASTMLFPGSEGPAPTVAHQVQGPTAVATPSVLLSGASSGSVPLQVDTGPELSVVTAPVSMGGRPALPFAVDTGSSQSVVAKSLADTLALGHTSFIERQTTVCSTTTFPLKHSGPWSVGTIALVAGPVISAALGPVKTAGFVGLIGCDQLVHFGWVVFDYRGARLVLGKRP
jgi:predicted aspartyl protease